MSVRIRELGRRGARDARGAIRALALALALVACDEGPRVRVETAAGFVPARGASVSIFGVFRDGRMSADSWTPLAKPISRALGKDACPVGWGDAMREAEPDLAQWVDEDTRENGLNEALFAKLAPKARGDLVMVLVAYRYMPRSRTRPAQPRRAAPSPAPGMRRGRYGRAPVMTQEEERVFELSATLYSVREKKLVAEIDLRYPGDDLDQAMNAFVAKLATVVPGAGCVGWTWPDAPAEEPEP